MYERNDMTSSNILFGDFLLMSISYRVVYRKAILVNSKAFHQMTCPQYLNVTSTTTTQMSCNMLIIPKTQTKYFERFYFYIWKHFK